MKGGQDPKPTQRPYDVDGPATSPTENSLNILASDPDLNIRAFVAGGLVAMASHQQAKTRNQKEPNYPAWAILIYLAIVIGSAVIFFLPSTNADHKNQALGFFFGQATLLLSVIFKKNDKD